MNLVELTGQVLKEMERLGYKESVIKRHVSLYRKFINFAKSGSESIYNEALGQRFLLEKYNIGNKEKIAKLPWQKLYSHSAIRKLGEYQSYGMFGRNYPKGFGTEWAKDDKEFVEAFGKSLELLDVVKTTKTQRLSCVKEFYHFIGFEGLTSAKAVTADMISKYVNTLQGYAQTFIRDILKDLRNYFRFLYSNGYIAIDLSTLVPRMFVPEHAKVPAIWKDSDVEQLLLSVDRVTPIGKRDYAILMLTLALGLRSCDVRKLKLSDLEWSKKEISVAQSKTGVINICPMTDEVGWALIDYIRFGRPKSDSQYVFLRGIAPYVELGGSALNNVLWRYITRSGIKPKAMGVARGMHSLRHTFARKLLNQNVPLELISDIMGHTELTSASPYLKIDIEGLRDCALSIEEVKKLADATSL